MSEQEKRELEAFMQWLRERPERIPQAKQIIQDHT